MWISGSPSSQLPSVSFKPVEVPEPKSFGGAFVESTAYEAGSSASRYLPEDPRAPPRGRQGPERTDELPASARIALRRSTVGLSREVVHIDNRAEGSGLWLT